MQVQETDEQEGSGEDEGKRKVETAMMRVSSQCVSWASTLTPRGCTVEIPKDRQGEGEPVTKKQK